MLTLSSSSVRQGTLGMRYYSHTWPELEGNLQAMAQTGGTVRLTTKRPLQELTGPRSTLGSTSSVNTDTNGANVHGSVPDAVAENKRRRTVLACSACRTRKTRCDGSRPICSGCETQGYQCVYAQPSYSENVTVGREHLFTIESRLSSLERKFKLAEQRASRHTPLQLDLPVERVDDNWQDGDNRVIVDDDVVPELSGLDYPTDSMGAMVFTEEEDFGFFGPSSNIAFTRHISQAVARVTQSRQTWATPGTEESLKFAGRMTRHSGPASPVRRPQGTERAKETAVNIYFVPTEAETRSLINLYFVYIGSLYPYLHEATFIETYEEMKRNNFRKVRRTWFGLFNMVLALATSVPHRSDITVDQRTERANHFYQRALSLCKEQMMRGTNLEIVQFLLLVGQYLQGTRQSLETWTVHGLAVKAALQLGLHSDDEAIKRFPPLEREIRKRTWYGCILLDKTLSMTFGRPPTIHEDYVRVDLPACYPESLPVDTGTNPSELVSLECFNATIKLYKIMSQSIKLLYGGNVGSNAQSDVFSNIAQLFSLEQQLAEWKGSLPPSLVLRESQDLSRFGGGELPAYERSRVVLTLRYHNVRILVHRLILVRFLDMAGKDDLDEQQFASFQQIGFNSVQTCMHAASEIINSVREVVHSTGFKRTLLGAWWFTLYYGMFMLGFFNVLSCADPVIVFNAALVIFSGLLIQKGCDGNLSFSAALEVSRTTLDNAAAALQRLDVGNRMAEKCSKYVEQLGRLVDLIGSFSHRHCPLEMQRMSLIISNVELAFNLTHAHIGQADICSQGLRLFLTAKRFLLCEAT
jgi:Fungal specific transcription factor domain/Fungal Zn(2)-Cys(6) binuclear cluster domain